jgi:hypothetical protein
MVPAWFIDLFHNPRRAIALLSKILEIPTVHWVVGKCRSFHNDIALSKWSPFTNHPPTQSTCAEFLGFAKQRNGGGGSEKDQKMDCYHSLIKSTD